MKNIWKFAAIAILVVGSIACSNEHGQDAKQDPASPAQESTTVTETTVTETTATDTAAPADPAAPAADATAPATATDTTNPPAQQ